MAVRFLRSPRQASVIYDVGGPGAVRPKNLFFIRFTRATSPNAVLSGSPQTASSWDRDLAFYCKQVDRPSISPVAEELNQYNKRRFVHTGYKVAPMRVTFYDTADSLAHQMWIEYSKFYFGDFNHDNDTTRADFNWDVTLDAINDQAGAGFGFAPKSAAASNTDNQSQFFFQSISVYQVFRQQFLQFDLINPKIASFDPSELSYEDGGASTINMSIVYEAIIYRNNGVPQAISADSFVQASFQDLALDGDVLDVPADTITAAQTVQTVSDAQGIPDYSPPINMQMVPDLNPTPSGTVATGSLTSYGQFMFGSLENDVTPVNIATDLSTLAATQPAVASALNIIPPDRQADHVSRFLEQPNTLRPPSIAQADLDAAEAAFASMNGGSLGDLSMGQVMAMGLLAAAQYAKNSPLDQVRGSDNAVDISLGAYDVLNAERSATSQIGINRSA